MVERMNFGDLHAFYRKTLLDDVVPFWMKYALDRDKGGINSCINDDGTLISRDKYMWSQLRAIWTFSALYNKIERRQEWLDAARGIYEFASEYGRDDRGRWVFLVDGDGRVKEGATSIYADGFAMYGLTEYARATGDQRAIALARETFRNVQERLARPGSYGVAPFEIPEGSKAHGISMIFSSVFFELGKFLKDDEILAASRHHALEVMDHYRRPDKQLLLEYLRLDNTPIHGPQGRVVVPGHAIESMWFQIHIFRELGDAERIRQAVECIRWHHERGWDEEFGGLFLGIDAEGQEPSSANADKKLWWPHTEALYALLLAHEHSREPWCMDWYWRVHDYSFAHFPDREHGEWTQRLDREGRRIATLVALPVKDPFHLPRALMYCIDVLSRLKQA